MLKRRPEVELHTAMQSRLGLDVARQLRPDLILLDLLLPDLPGREVLTRLRATPETADIPVVVLSADATRAEGERLLALGANRYPTKPLDVQAFLRLVDERVERAAAAAR